MKHFPATSLKLARSLGVLAAVCLVGACQTPPSSAVSTLAEQIDDLVGRYESLGRFSGSVLVAVDGEVILAQGYGYADRGRRLENRPDTRFRLASLSKQFTAAAILKLETDGRLSVDDPLSRHLSDYPRPAADRITIHHLLTHSSGVPSVGRFGDGLDEVAGGGDAIATEALLELFQRRELLFEPGDRYRYNNSGYQVLAAIVERASGKSFDEFLREDLFEPLGMSDTGCRPAADLAVGYSGYPPRLTPVVPDHPSWSLGDGCAWSTVEDLFRWERALTTDALLPEAARRKLFHAWIERATAGHYGYGWFLSELHGRRLVHHGGSDDGAVAEMYRLPDDDLTVVALANLLPRLGINAPRAIAQAAVALALGEPVELPPLPAAATGDATIWVGRYEMASGGALAVSSGDGGLWIEGADPRRSVFDYGQLEDPASVERATAAALALAQKSFTGNFAAFADALCPPLRAELTEADLRAEWQELFAGRGRPGEIELATPYRYPGEALFGPVFRLAFGPATVYLLLEMTPAAEACGWTTMSPAEFEIWSSLRPPTRVSLVELAPGEFLADGFNYGEGQVRVRFSPEPAGIVVEGAARHEGRRGGR